ncbi:hypothetical protein PR048_023459 [Dryococelus australis]|uniref:Uncharacterized protein n=1 Tax=Dryococelus australis TaxID=614101 RepID=A0ABQ9GU41_9NEOP|nr:hypothetical protein PR048_023459 [Dryococelus australis]
MLFWLRNKTPDHVQTIRMFFPARGHSFLPADRVLGRLEEDIRKHHILTTKEQYYDIFKKHADVKTLGADWVIYDGKLLEESYKKLQAIQSPNRIIIKRGQQSECKIITHKHYRFETGQEKHSC